MSKLTENQIATAKDLLKKYQNEKQVFVKVENGHMYFDKGNALASVGGDEKKLEVIGRNADKAPVDASKETGDKGGNKGGYKK